MMQIPENPQDTSNVSNAEDRKKFTWVGFGLLLAFILTIGLEVLILFLTKEKGISELYRYLFVDLTMLFLAFPAGALLLRKAGRGTAPLGQRKGIGVFAALLAVATELGICGQLVGTLFATGDAAAEPLLPQTWGEALLFIFVIGIAEPICEELFFRQCLTGALRQWGWFPAVLLGSIFYALFHGSLSQFLMALGLGAVFSYADLTTGKLRYPLCIHLFVNLFFQVIPTLSQAFLCSDAVLVELDTALMAWRSSGYLDYATLAELLRANPGALSALMVSNLTGILELGLSVAGTILLLFYSRKAGMEPGERQLDRRSIGDTIFLSPGILLFILTCVAVTALTLFRG